MKEKVKGVLAGIVAGFSSTKNSNPCHICTRGDRFLCATEFAERVYHHNPHHDVLELPGCLTVRDSDMISEEVRAIRAREDGKRRVCSACGTRQDPNNIHSHCPAVSLTTPISQIPHRWRDEPEAGRDVDIDPSGRAICPHVSAEVDRVMGDKQTGHIRVVGEFGYRAPTLLPTDSKERKDTPIYSGFIKYFPLAIAAVAQLSKSANEKHNPGEPLHWSKGKSNDHPDCMARHLVEIDDYDSEPDHDYRYLHAVKNAWRAMAHLQTVLETGKAPRIPKDGGQ